MKEIKAPYSFSLNDKDSLYLAGSIEMGKAENWQEKVVRLMAGKDWFILNPRRDDWDSSWVQSIHNTQFCEQVKWELLAMQLATRILMYFCPGTNSPISLLEFGLYALSNKMIVVCPEGFYRKGNVDIVCRYYAITQADTIEEAIKLL